MGGSGLLSRYMGKLQKVLRALYPFHNWETAKFQNEEVSKETQRHILEFVASKLPIKDYTDWYTVNQADIASFGPEVRRIFAKHNLAEVIPKIFPEYNWEPEKFVKQSIGWNDFETSKKNKASLYLL
jgi:hypothetical protein